MLAFVLRRLLQSTAVMAVVSFIAFGLFNYVGDPVAGDIGLLPDGSLATTFQNGSETGLKVLSPAGLATATLPPGATPMIACVSVR